MTFDPNATPVTDRLRKWEIDSAQSKAVVFAVECAEMEKRASLAEEKLRIALEFIEIDCHDMTGLMRGMRRATLEEIEKVGKHD